MHYQCKQDYFMKTINLSEGSQLQPLFSTIFIVISHNTLNSKTRQFKNIAFKNYQCVQER